MYDTHKILLIVPIIVVVATAFPSNLVCQAKGQLFTDRLIANGERNLNLIENNSTSYYMIWEQNRPQNQSSDIFFKYSNDGGNTFSDTIKLSNFTSEVQVKNPFTNNTSTNEPISPPAINYDPVIATLNNQVHVLWQGIVNETGKINIFYTFSTDGGKTFSPPVDISNPNIDSVYPQIKINKDSQNPIIVFLTSDGPVIICRGSHC